MVRSPRFIFIGARLALDFAQTGGKGERARWERWHTPSDLADWMQACPSLNIGVEATNQDLTDACMLRETILRSSKALLENENPIEDDLKVLNDFANQPNLVPVLEFGSVVWAKGSTGQQVLSSVARDAISLFGSADKLRLRKCQNPTCGLMFVDTSRPGKRVWCSMERCGNLHKIARYRADQKTTGNKAANATTKGR
jgi:predicted RNA-binding Zn ribbon-like protein